MCLFPLDLTEQIYNEMLMLHKTKLADLPAVRESALASTQRFFKRTVPALLELGEVEPGEGETVSGGIRPSYSQCYSL